METPYQPVDEAARAQAAALMTGARTAALGVLDATGAPSVSRVATAMIDGAPALLVSSLSAHARALAADPRCSLLVGEPGAKGDPLTHPRLTLSGHAVLADKAAGRAEWLVQHPKAQLYIDFADFSLLRVLVQSAFLNAGFGRAFLLAPADLGLAPTA
jgi:heme iron utilization protein